MKEELETPFQQMLQEKPDWSNPDNIRLLVNRIWEVTHGPSQTDGDREDMLTNLSFLSGIACAALLNYAKALETS